METIQPLRRHRLALLAVAAVFLSLSTPDLVQAAGKSDEVVYRSLIDAVKAGDVDQARRLIERGHDVNQVSKYLNSDTPLMLAVKAGHMGVFELLLEKRADVNKPGLIGGVVPLHVAAWQGNMVACRRLIDAGADVRKKTSAGWTPLHYAARHGRLEFISLFLAEGCDVNARDAKGMTPLHLALEFTTPKVALFLIDSGADVLIPDGKNVTTFEKACRLSSLPTVKSILSRMPPDNGSARQQLLKKGLNRAFIQDFVELERFLVEQGADLDIRMDERYTPLHFSAEYGFEDSVALLLENGVDVSSRTDVARWTPLHFACLNAHLGVVRMLCEHGAEIDALDGMNRTPLHLAAISGDVSVVTELVRHGADTSLQDKDGNTPLHHAVTVGNRKMLQQLVRAAPTDLDLDNAFGRTPLQIAMGLGRPELAKLLAVQPPGGTAESTFEGIDDAVKAALLTGVPEGEIKARRAEVERYLKAGERPLHIVAREGSAGAAQKILAADASELTARDKYGYLPIHIAANMGHAGLVASFVDHGVPVGDQTNTAKWSPLHFAASGGHVDVVEVLLAAQADAEAKDGNGRTALDVASFHGKNDIVALLRDRLPSR